MMDTAGAVLLNKPPDWRVVANALQRAHNLEGPFGPFTTAPWSRFGRGGESRRVNIDLECGYPDETEMDSTWFKRAYARWGIAARVVNIWPDECWAVYPQITDSDDPGDSEFDKGIDEVFRKTLLPSYWHRADRLSRICQFGVMFLGFDDGGRLDQPPPGIDPDTGLPKDGVKPKKPLGLNYVRAFDQTLVRVSATDKNIHSPRYGQPKHYSVQFSSTPAAGVGPGTANPSNTMIENRVHWTRIIHLADNRISSEVFGTPAMLIVANDLHNLRKVTGGSAEMFWRGGFPGYAFETYPDLAGDAFVDPSELKEQIENYSRGMERYLATVGGKWNSLAPQVANPDKHLEWYSKLICAAIDVPTSIFLGRESGHLAGSKEDENWKNRCRGRQTRYQEPFIVRPTIDRLVNFGVVAKPKDNKYKANWTDIRLLSEKEKVDIALKKAQALQTFFSGGIEQKFSERLFLTLIMGFTESQADAIQEDLEANPPEDPIAVISAPPEPANPGGLRSGKAAVGKTGRPAGGSRDGETKSATKPGSAGRRARLHANRRF